jgi:1,4-alpha-glucan branching enzyme
MNANATERKNRKLAPINFEVWNADAELVCVAGSFNEWNPECGVMTREYRDHWVRTIALEAGRHEYRLVVDGRWIVDPLNQASVENPFGSRNSVLFIEPAMDDVVHMVDAAREPILHLVEDQTTQLRNRAARVCQEMALPAAADSTMGRTALGPRTV